MKNELAFDGKRAGLRRAGYASCLLALTALGCADTDQSVTAPLVTDEAADEVAAEPLAAEADAPSEALQAASPACDEVYEVRAKGAAAGSPYMVPAGGEFHPQIIVDAPWGNEKVQAVNFKPITDNKKVLHHWILYASGGGFGMLTGWAPGDDEEVPYPADVGMDMPTGARSLRLDMHYYNTQGKASEPDRSGVEVCVVKGKNLRPKSAGIAMGLTAIGAVLAPANKRGHNITGTCNVRASQPVYLMTASPHAHKYARRMKFVLRKAGGQEIVMHDHEFQFGEQGTYPLSPPVVVNTGDTITTTCTYDNDTNKNIRFGESTEDEMCFNFASYYPKGALSCSGGGFGR